MTKTLYATLAALITIAGAALVVPTDSNAKHKKPGIGKEPVLLELFTSQGCSSCPPADRLAARMASEQGVVVISRPVDYWDRLGWKDTLARPENTALQRAYAKRGLGGYNGVYTPQIVVSGSLGEVGSAERKIRRLMSEATSSQTAAIRVSLRRDGGYNISVIGTSAARAEITLIGVSRNNSVAIGRGENRGRKIGYTNVVQGERRIGSWSGQTSSLVLDRSQLSISGVDRYALVVRMPSGGRVLAARWLS